MTERVFVSYAGPDRAWAEWVGWQLGAAGLTVELDVWDWAAGENFVANIARALDRCDRVVALFSSAYFEAGRWTQEEWTAAVRRLVPVRVEDVEPPALLRPLISASLFGVDATEARRRLLTAVRGPAPPETAPPFPGRDPTPARGPPLPGSNALPSVWRVPARDPGFVGRDLPLVALREGLCAGGRVAVRALHGIGGVGKSALATEYAWRFAAGYDVVWWCSAERAEGLGEQFAALGVALGVTAADSDTPTAVRAVRAALRARDRWLLVLDNAEVPEALRDWLPAGPGHVVITSRTSGWGRLAVPVEVDLLTRIESVALLRGACAGLAEADADGLADALGDLPLGLAQAAGFLATTGMPAPQYRTELASRAAELLDEHRPVDYPRSLAAATAVSTDRLATTDPAALDLLRLGAFLAPEPIPVEVLARTRPRRWLTARRRPDNSAVALRRRLATLAALGLARVSAAGLTLHRLTQAVVRDQLPAADRATARAGAESLVVAAAPGNPDDPATWPGWAALLPHAVALDPATSDNEALRGLACNGTWYLLTRGELYTGRDLADHLYSRWRERLGPDDPHTLWAVNSLAAAWRNLGRPDLARPLNEDSLARSRRVWGGDHPHTLVSAINLAIDMRALGELAAARELDEDTLARSRRALGDDHPETLASAHNLANDLHEVGELAAARELHEDTLARCRRMFGDDHPFTLGSAHNLANDLHELGELAAARELREDTLGLRRRVLGDDHPDTLTLANNLAVSMHALGELSAARELNEDTLARSRRILGDDHPDTLLSVRNLAITLRALGEDAATHDLESDTEARRRPEI